jgi:pimeloyl-ACP methyl ester carboxylesterase
LAGTTRSPESRTVVGSDGSRIAVQHYGGGAAPGVVLVHGTSFCKETWGPVVDSLPAERPVVSIDQRGHGDSSPIVAPFDWWDLGRDVVAVCAAFEWDRPIGVGHSSGAAALVLAELLRPGRFAAMVLIEPILFPGPFFRAEHNPMSDRALRRRATFPSPADALASFRGRGPFARWDERVLRLYVTHGLRSAGEQGWTLKCSPQQEAEFYRGATLHGAWDRLGEIACPVLVVGGERSESHPRAFLELQAAQFRTAEIRSAAGCTHFVPMEDPKGTARLIRDRLAD